MVGIGAIGHVEVLQLLSNFSQLLVGAVELILFLLLLLLPKGKRKRLDRGSVAALASDCGAVCGIGIGNGLSAQRQRVRERVLFGDLLDFAILVLLLDDAVSVAHLLFAFVIEEVEGLGGRSLGDRLLLHLLALAAEFGNHLLARQPHVEHGSRLVLAVPLQNQISIGSRHCGWDRCCVRAI